VLLLGLVCLAGGEKRGIDVRFSPGFCLIVVHAVGKKPWRCRVLVTVLGALSSFLSSLPQQDGHGEQQVGRSLLCMQGQNI